MKKLIKIISHNFSYKMIALLFAVILWSLIIAETNPIRDKTISNVPISFRNENTLRNHDLIMLNDIKEELMDGVQMDVQVPMKEWRNVTADTLAAYVDLSRFDTVGEREIAIRAESTNRDCNVVRITPGVITIEIDNLVRKNVPVSANIIGEVPVGYWAGEPTMPFSGSIEIEGAQRDVDRVQKAVCNINLIDVRESISESLPVTLLDENGNEITDGTFTNGSPSIIVDLEVLPVKTVSVDTEDCFIGVDEVAEGFEFAGGSCTPEEVRVAGNVEDLTSLKLESINLQGLNRNVTTIGKIVLPEGVKLVDQTQVEVVAYISEKREQREFESVPIGISGLGEGLSATLSTDKANITIEGRLSLVKAMKAEEVELFVDLSGFAEGQYRAEVRYMLIEELMNENIKVIPDTISVTISKNVSAAEP